MTNGDNMNGTQFKAAVAKMSEADKVKFQAAINKGNIATVTKIINKYISTVES
tara:strand:- start:507 stop:665 length:159 start_codon:yes stop_codon:yes gene_type:complete